MYPQFSIATVILGSVFSMASFAAELESDDEKKRRASGGTVPSFENVVDIHNSPVILEHPTKMNSGAQSTAALRKSHQAGEIRERHMRSWYQSQGKAYPERFKGD
ncbi:MAG: hypothetical protein PHP85_08975 [Gallionella sp.]|nr:hypothetical protein [Gallionella sp.]